MAKMTITELEEQWPTPNRTFSDLVWRDSCDSCTPSVLSGKKVGLCLDCIKAKAELREILCQL